MEKNTVQGLRLLSLHSNTSVVFSESSKYFLHWKKYYYIIVDSKIEAVCFLLDSTEKQRKKRSETITEMDSKSQWAKLQEMSTSALSLLKSVTQDKQTGSAVPNPSFQLFMTRFPLCKAEVSRVYLIWIITSNTHLQPTSSTEQVPSTLRLFWDITMLSLNSTRFKTLFIPCSLR